jgi:hypothetical protein
MAIEIGTLELDITKPQKRIYALPCYQNTKGQGMK